MKLLFAILLLAFPVSAAVQTKGAYRPEPRVTFSWYGRSWTTTSNACWSQHEISMAGWPNVLDWRKDGKEWAMDKYPCTQRGLFGTPGDRESRKFFVMTLEFKTNKNGRVKHIGRQLLWHTNRWVQDDPYLALPRPPGVKTMVRSTAPPTQPPSIVPVTVSLLWPPGTDTRWEVQYMVPEEIGVWRGIDETALPQWSGTRTNAAEFYQVIVIPPYQPTTPWIP